LTDFDLAVHVEQCRDHIGTMSELGSCLVRDVHACRGQHVAEHDAQAMADGLAMRTSGECAMRRRLATAQIGIIDDVIMHQRTGLEHFHRAR